MSSRSTLSVKEAVARGIARRYRNEAIFRALGLGALLIGLGFLAFFFYTLDRQRLHGARANAHPARRRARRRRHRPRRRRAIPRRCAARTISAWRATRSARLFPEVTSRADLRALYALLSAGAGIELQELVVQRSRGDRRDAHAVAARRRRHRRARQRPRASRRSRGGPPRRRPAARLADGARAAGPRGPAVQSLLLHERRLAAIPSSPASGARRSARSSCCS